MTCEYCQKNEAIGPCSLCGCGLCASCGPHCYAACVREPASTDVLKKSQEAE